MSSDLERFLEKYESMATMSSRQYARRKPISFTDYHRHYSSLDVYDYESYVERQPYVEVLIPQHRLQDLVEKDYYYTKLEREHDYATQVVNQMVKDEVVRKQNPAVEKAWRNYQLLLEIARK